MKRLKILIFALAAFSLCASAAPKIIGHRGSYWGVENTAEAFINGAKEGYDCLETDVKVTKDGKFVCWHDDILSLTPSQPTIYTTNYSDLRALTLTQTRGGVTYTGHICTVEEYLDICKQYNVTPVIELKYTTGITYTDQSKLDDLMQIVIDKGFRNNCYIFTSMKQCLQFVKTNYPDVETMLLCYSENFDNSLQWCIDNDCHIGSGVGSEITKAGVKKYHDAGLLVNAWSINNLSDFNTYYNYGCDFITTDYLQTEDLPSDDGNDDGGDDGDDDGDDNQTPSNVNFQTVWERSTTLGNAPSNIDGTNAQQGSAHNGVFYVNNSVEKKLHLFGSEAQYLGSVAGGAGYGIDCDDVGNVIIRDENATDGNHKFIIYPASATGSNLATAKNVEVTLPISGETHFISASGDVLGSKGGYIYMYPNGQTSVCVISMTNGVVNNVTQHSGLSITGSTAGYVIPMDNNPNKWIYQVRDNGYYLYNNGTSSAYQAEASSIEAPNRNSTVGGEYFKLGGEEYFIHSSGANYKGGFTVRNRTTGKVITSVEPIGTLGYETGGNYSVSNWVRVEAIDNYSCYIYQYCPANGMAVYKMSIPSSEDDGGNDEPLEDAVFALDTEWQRGTALGNAPSNIDGYYARQGSAHNGIFYVNNMNEKKLHLFGSEAQYLGSIPGGAGIGVDCDDVGNVIIRNENSSTVNRQLIIYPAGVTVDNYGTPITIDITLPVEGTTDYISASGNVLGSEGGYVYMYPNGQSAVCVISIVNGNLQKIDLCEDLTMTAGNGGYVVPKNNNPQTWYYQHRTTGINFYNNGTSSLHLKYQNATQPNCNSTVGGEYFKLAGHEFFIHNSGTHYCGGFTIRKLSGEVLTSVAPIGNVGYKDEVSTSTANWVRAEAIDNYSCYIYQYCPANGMAVYRFYTPAPVSNARASVTENNDILVTWDKPTSGTPTKYAISYQVNGGTWSIPLETSYLTYTFSELTAGTYKFKIVPYYGSTDVWGSEALTSDIELLEDVTADYDFIVTKRWERKGVIDESIGGVKTMAVSNDNVYVISPSNLSTISYMGPNVQEGIWPKFESGYTASTIGYAMDNDDAGNIIVKTGTSIGSQVSQITVYPAGATSDDVAAKVINLNDAVDCRPGARSDLFAIQGNLYDGVGYIWAAPYTAANSNVTPNVPASGSIVRITIENGKATHIDRWPNGIKINSVVLGSTETIVRPLSDSRLYYHARSNGFRIITLPEPGTEITTSMTQSITDKEPETTSNPSYCIGSDMFTLQGKTFHVKHAGNGSKSISFIIKNIDEGNLLPFNGNEIITPFDGKSYDGNNDGISGTANYRGSIFRAIKIDNYNYDIYCYSGNHGATVYRVTAAQKQRPTDNLESLNYRYVLSPVEGGDRQDIELTWIAPDEVEPAGYKIYRNGSLIASIGSSSSHYMDEGVSANNTYLVVPIFDGAAEDAGLGLEVTTTEVTTILYAPIITETRSYNGYAIAQIFFKMPKLSKVKPTYFNIYRGNELLIGEITQYNFIDENLPQTIDAQTYEYRVEAVYAGATYNDATRMSESKTVEVTPRDWALVGYNIEEIYNVPINEIDANTLPGLFNEKDYYRQGHFYDGHWYIAQRADGVYSANDEYVPVDPNTTGGVIKIKATNEADVKEGMASKPISYAPYVSVGLAMDDKGTIFVRNNDLEKLVATTPLDGDPSKIAGIKDGFGRRITEGLLYERNANGEYTAAPIELDLTKLWTDNRWIDEMYFNTAKSYGQVAGRSDYYYMWGDVMSAEGGYLILSPTWTRTAFKVKIVSGQYHSHEVIQFESYDEYNEYTGETEHHIVASGTENYGFKIDGRDAWMSQIRSNGYYGVHDDEVGEEHWHAIFDADSRINNSGGTSIVAFNETFLITPACMYSNNIGDFIVTRGTKESINVPAADAELAPPMPVAQFKQADRSTNIATNSNGNWFHAELGTYVSATDENAECVYIYQYVPGVRFAKYRLYPDDQLQPINPTLEIKTAYDDAKTEITHFNAVSTWKRPQDFGIEAGENAHAKVKSYTYELLNDKGVVIYSDEVIDNDYANNLPPTDASDDDVYTFNFDQTVTEDIKHTLDFQTYTARVAVNYEIVNEATTRQSEFGYARAKNTYTEAPAEDLGVWTFKQANTTQQVWEEVNGKWVVVEKQFDAYRVELDFNKPDHDEPVSYYTIKAVVNNQTDTIEITNFNLHQGMEVVNGVEQAKFITTSQVPGTYDFDNDKAPYYHKVGDYEGTGGQSRQKSVLTWHHLVPAGTYTSGVVTAANGEEIIITDEPNDWLFIVDAHYAARNRYIAKAADADISPEGREMIETGVELIGDDNASSVKIYPIPATTTITIKSNEAINSIVVYNEAGVEMMTVDGNGDNVTELNIENLATGYYFVKVNETKPVKIIKK